MRNIKMYQKHHIVFEVEGITFAHFAVEGLDSLCTVTLTQRQAQLSRLHCISHAACCSWNAGQRQVTEIAMDYLDSLNTVPLALQQTRRNPRTNCHL